MIQQMPFEEYAALDAVNWSRLSQMRRSPMHCRVSRRETPAMHKGTAAHSIILTSDEFDARYVIGPVGHKGKLAANGGVKEAWDEIQRLAEQTGRVAITGEDARDIIEMRQRIAENPDAANMLNASIAIECVVTWEEGDLPCKARIDAYTAEHVIDLKTMRDASIDAARRDMTSREYHGQLAWYRRGLRANGIAIDKAAMLAVENEPPFASAVYEIEAAALAQGDREADCYLARWRQCVKSGKWPGYQGVHVIGLNEWAQDDHYGEEIQ